MFEKVISVIGLGYIGLPTAVLLANSGYKVFGTDINNNTVEKINKGKIPIVEPELEEFLQTALSGGCLVASTQQSPADIYLICVPTPLYEKNGQPKPNIDNVISAAETVAPFLKPNDIVIIESTCPIGTTQLIETNLRESGAPINEIHIAYCPERVLPGKIMSELVENDRIVGGNTETATVIAAEFYRTFVSGRVFETNAKTAELCKLAENSFRDVNIAFANELSMICENEKIDVWSLIQLANRHPRVNILQPGPGVGGHCIAVDPWFIVAHDAKNSNLIRCAREINDSKTKWVIDRIKDAASVYSKGTGTTLKIACFGLAFKPNIDDLRGSPALEVALALKARGYDVIGVEPNIIEHNKIDLFPIEQALDEADILILLVGHKEFLVPKIKQKLAKKTTLDFCGVLK